MIKRTTVKEMFYFVFYLNLNIYNTDINFGCFKKYINIKHCLTHGEICYKTAWPGYAIV